MSYEIHLSKMAQSELNEIFSYIAFQIPQLSSLQNAEQQIARLGNRISGLSDLPLRFRLHSEEPWRSMGIRVMPVDNYLVFYRVDEAAKEVYIYHILSNRRNIATEKRTFE